MSNFATDSCHNLFQPGCTFYLHGFSGGTRRDTGAFLNLAHYNACIFLVIRILHIYIYAFTLR